MEKILLVLTGGTICSFVDMDGIKNSNCEKAMPLLIDNFNKSSPEYMNVDFDVISPIDILSENMTIADWNSILDILRNKNFSDYKGIIITHGTDTLAYTSSMLSIMLSGSIIPVILVSSQYPLTDLRANGYSNFKYAVKLILKGMTPNVYAVYRNSDDITYIHFASELIQCGNFSDDFFSKNMTCIEKWTSFGNIKHKVDMLLSRGKLLENCVLSIEPYLSIDYSSFILDSKKAVIHYLYHSSTAAAECVKKENSILYIIEKCNKLKIPFIIAPFNSMLFNEGEDIYSSTEKILNAGAIPFSCVTKEMAYSKTVIAVSYFREDEVRDFLQTEINGEFIYKKLLNGDVV